MPALVDLHRFGLGSASLGAAIAGWACLWMSAGPAVAQEASPAPRAAAPGRTPAAAAPADKELRKIPPPEDVTLQTSDGVELAARFYPGSLKKESVPIICLHAHKGDRGEYDALAEYLQNVGHAVIVPDLRGHGQSTRGTDGLVLEAAALRPGDFKDMVRWDVEAVKKFLMQENNRGELNINKLCIIGTEMGSVVALNWALVDWSWPPLAIGKQGQDVKALVLISPEWAFKGMNISLPMANEYIRHDLSIMLVVGKGSSRHLREANKIHKLFERFHPVPPKEEREKQDLFFVPLDTKLQGTKLLGENLSLEELISRFINLRLAKQPFAWSDRRTPLD